MLFIKQAGLRQPKCLKESPWFAHRLGLHYPPLHAFTHTFYFLMLFLLILLGLAPLSFYYLFRILFSTLSFSQTTDSPFLNFTSIPTLSSHSTHSSSFSLHRRLMGTTWACPKETPFQVDSHCAIYTSMSELSQLLYGGDSTNKAKFNS